ncbi:MAG: glycoside hydrolase family 30 protein [Christensenellales bacterium]|jgi:glucosylceramidase
MKPDTLVATRTLYDGSAMLEKREASFRPAVTLDENTLLIDPRTQHQPMLGFGGTWTDTDVYNLLRMSPEKQEEVLTALFDPEKGAGWNFMRLPFGSTDWESTYDFYTYDDVPRGEKDWELAHFSIQRDIDRGLFKLARRCKEINPEVIFLGSVWGVPGWMKNNDSIMYGIFDPQYTDVYARYLRKTVQAYAEQGVDLYAVTPQNESLISEDRATPACRFTWRLQRDVILALRKEFDAHGITTQIWAFDDTFSKSPWFVTPLLADEAARKALDGIAYHNYGGRVENMGEVAREFAMPVYMTERCPHDVPAYIQMLEQLQNEARSYISWTTLCNEYGGPHQGGDGKRPYSLFPRRGYYAFITNKWETPDDWEKTPMYGLFAQFSKYIRRGMRRVDCSPGCRGLDHGGSIHGRGDRGDGMHCRQRRGDSSELRAPLRQPGSGDDSGAKIGRDMALPAGGGDAADICRTGKKTAQRTCLGYGGRRNHLAGRAKGR